MVGRPASRWKSHEALQVVGGAAPGDHRVPSDLGAVVSPQPKRSEGRGTPIRGRDVARGPLRVLQVTPRFIPSVGGVETHVWEVSRRLIRSGVAVTVLTTDASGSLPASEAVDGIPVLRVRAWPTDGDYMFAPGLAARIRRPLWDLVHVQSYHTLVAPTAMASAARAGVPYVVTFHGGGHSSALRSRLRGVQLRTLRPLLRRAERLVAVADFEVERYGRLLRLDPTRFVTIPNGAELPTSGHLSGVTPDSGTLIVSLGRLEAYKGHHRVLRAMPHVLAEIPDARLWIAGAGPEAAALRALAADLGIGDRVEIGVVDRATLAVRLRAAALTVLLSEFETHPIAVLEAASLGVPLVVADSTGLLEMVRRGYADGVPLDGDPSVHARAFVERIRAPRTAPPPVPTWDACAAQLRALYQEATDHARAPRGGRTVGSWLARPKRSL